jgi:hypothetical protein
MGKQTFTYEITEFDWPRRSGFKLRDGPILPVGTIDVEPLDGDTRSRVTPIIDFHGHRYGKLLLPLVRRDAPQARAADRRG